MDGWHLGTGVADTPVSRKWCGRCNGWFRGPGMAPLLHFLIPPDPPPSLLHIIIIATKHWLAFAIFVNIQS